MKELRDHTLAELDQLLTRQRMLRSMHLVENRHQAEMFPDAEYYQLYLVYSLRQRYALLGALTETRVLITQYPWARNGVGTREVIMQMRTTLGFCALSFGGEFRNQFVSQAKEPLLDPSLQPNATFDDIDRPVRATADTWLRECNFQLAEKIGVIREQLSRAGSPHLAHWPSEG